MACPLQQMAALSAPQQCRRAWQNCLWRSRVTSLPVRTWAEQQVATVASLQRTWILRLRRGRVGLRARVSTRTSRLRLTSSGCLSLCCPQCPPRRWRRRLTWASHPPCLHLWVGTVYWPHPVPASSTLTRGRAPHRVGGKPGVGEARQCPWGPHPKPALVHTAWASFCAGGAFHCLHLQRALSLLWRTVSQLFTLTFRFGHVAGMEWVSYTGVCQPGVFQRRKVHVWHARLLA